MQFDDNHQLRFIVLANYLHGFILVADLKRGPIVLANHQRAYTYIHLANHHLGLISITHDNHVPA